jgi:hypothetical protein
MRHLTTRRATGGLAAFVVAALLPLLAPAAPALAADPCLSEAQPTDPVLMLPTGPGCDDTVPPTTSILTSRPAPVDGWIKTTSVTIEFFGEYTDADADPISYECQFYDSPAAPTTWSPCTTPVSYDGLDERGATPYTFRVRAVDTADDGHDLTTDPFFPGDADLPDYDQTPAQLVFRADATAPGTFGFLRSSYYDQNQQDNPMVTSTSVQLRLQSDEGDDEHPARYRCRLNGRAVSCADGLTTLRGLKPGTQRFTAAAVDPAGNVDPTPYAQSFFVPRNLTLGDALKSSKGAWRKARIATAFAGDYLESSTYGATLSFPARNIREIRLLAPAGPGLGKVEVRVGHGAWTTVNLSSAGSERIHVYQVRDRFTGLMSGPIQLRVASRGKPVRVDAVSAR